MPSEEVIELSVKETNKLRAELGLKPLRVERDPSEKLPVARETESDKNGEEEALELSVEETNKLREKLGLAPLRDTGGSKKKEVHKPAENTGLQEEASQRIEQAKLRRQVEQGATQVFGSSTLALGDDKNDGGGLSWADKMRKQTKAPQNNMTKKSKQQQKGDYDEADLEGMQVRNSMAGLEVGENAVLTLADSSILETKTFVSNKVVGINEEEDALENIQLTENEKQRDGLRKKRMLEMGMGRAGGYAGFDDDEFEELGGTLAPSSQHRGMSKENTKESQGFRLGSQTNASEDASKTDFDKVMQGEAISLVWKGDAVSSDYMTKEEEQEAKRKKSKKEAKFKKKKKHKKDKKRRRRTDFHDDEDEEGANNAQIKAEENNSGNDLLSKLESTADSNQVSSLQKRRRIGDTDEDDEEQYSLSNTSSAKVQNVKGRLQQTNRKSYDKIMEKGNERTNQAFNTDRVAEKREDTSMLDEEPDDSFLNAALAKARRLNRLRKLNMVSSSGADAVAEAVKSTSVVESGNSKQSSGISFSIDDTREFSRAIRARTQQKERKVKKKAEEDSVQAGVPTLDEAKTGAQTNDGEMAEKSIKQEDLEEDVEMEEEEDLEELAKEVKEDDFQYGFDGSAADSAGVGRGLSSFVSMLKTTGEINGKHGGKEELRGRAKDERNYDNYEPLDLSKVVSIGKNATSKDRELANREIKLEYRDNHGRLLTQKEAYRDLCYQFHGHGGGKRKEEKRLKQIAREQAEARMASRQVSAARDGTTAGTLGALRATQKATGKAYISHKT